ncbi:MAG: DEAD/DEAH box helicase family protein [Gemmataceae bacterium]
MSQNDQQRHPAIPNIGPKTPVPRQRGLFDQPVSLEALDELPQRQHQNDTNTIANETGKVSASLTGVLDRDSDRNGDHPRLALMPAHVPPVFRQLQPRLRARPVARSLFDSPRNDQVEDEPTSEMNGTPAETRDQSSAPVQIETTATKYRSLIAQTLVSPGEKGKAQDIVAAINILKVTERETRPCTSEELQTLARFAGFGPVALSIFPDPITGRYKDTNWQVLGEELKALLTEEEYASAKRTTFNAFYTSPTVVAAMHQALAHLGVSPNATVLEPGCGTGNFLRGAPCEMRFIGVELDSVTGRIAKALHPDQDIRIESFRDTNLPDSSLDAMIGNVPFANIHIDYRGRKLALHDFFLAKSMDALKPGGALAAVTTHFTLDKQNAGVRESLAAQADFVGAIRLPSDAFKREGTAVVTDILFMKKRASGVPPSHVDPEWLDVAPLAIDGADIPVNRYFHNHPEMVLGRWSRKDTLYGEGYSVKSSGDLARQLVKAIKRLPAFPLSQSLTEQKRSSELLPRPPPELQSVEGGFFIDQEHFICQRVDGQAVRVVYGGRKLRANGTLTGKRLAALVQLRDAARRVLQSQNEGWLDEQRKEARRELNWAYDRFSHRYGPINKTVIAKSAQGSVVRRMPNLAKFREDPDCMLVMSLEQYDESTGKAAKAAILNRDVVGPQPQVTSVNSAEEGLLVSLDRRGQVDLPYIASLYGKSESEVTRELGDLIFRDPDATRWQTADAYLSGNVRAKLAAVLNAGAEYGRNVEALAKVQPEDVLPGDIDAHLGAPWIPEGDICNFAAMLFKVECNSIQIGHISQDAIWSVVGNMDAERSVSATSEFGTARMNGVKLLELALNMKTPVIYDTIDHGDREEKVVNQEETLAAREKQKLIKERFREWIFSEAERTERLVRIYNDTYNNIRLRLFDGSHLDFSGMNKTVSLHSHQKDAIWRGMSAGNTLLAQAVGAGKTFIMAATGMKMRQAGLVRKPMYVVPNHLLEQFGREFLQLYPNARLLLAGKDDLARQKRKHLTAKIATGDWDGVLVTHSSFERIAMSRGYQERFLREQIEDYERLLADNANKNAARAQRNLIKAIEKQKAAREEKLKELLAAGKKDDGLVFDELGIDQLFIDEAHYFKNLETPTKMERVSGIQTTGSQRAFDLYMKARFLQGRHAGHGIIFATGTPVSNTMVELYTMQRYLDPDGLRSRGIDHFDAWAATFGEVIESTEIAPDGKSLRSRNRFAKFVNLPELQQMFRSFADVQTAEMLNLPRPKLETGKPIVVACPMSETQRELQAALVERYERIRTERVDPREDNALNITTDGRKLALDARMVSASATDFPDSKINALVSNVVTTWKQTAERRGAQMIFCDLGVHPTAWGYSVYENVTRKLIAGGIPQEQIVAIGEADSDQKKQALFEQVRSGRVRVLLGSTQKMGTGTNVQKRLVALHHLDAPWKPAEVEQREGRILRQGNDNEQVAIYRYVTEGSFDAYMWQALETKARFISQVMTGQSAVRRAEDVAGQELSYAEVKAIASGNPAVLTLAEADAELQRLFILKKNHADEQYLARRGVRELPAKIARLAERSAALTADWETATAHFADPVKIGGVACSKDSVVQMLGARLEKLPKHFTDRRRFEVGTYSGLRFAMELHPHFGTEVCLEGATTLRESLGEHRGPRAILNAAERVAKAYAAECAKARQELTIAEAQLRDYAARLDVPFAHATYLNRLTEMRDQLKASLSVTFQAEAEARSSASDLATQIKELKQRNSLDTTPQRLNPRQTTAEESVTTRIRRRLNGVLTSST